MTLAKCKGCGATRMVGDDGNPFWCIECSQKEDERQARRRYSTKGQVTGNET